MSLILGTLAIILGPVSIAACEPRHHVLDFSSEGLEFVVREPTGWFADTTIARQFGADVIFYPATADPHSSNTPVIRVLVLKKTGDDTGADLNHYMDRYRLRYRNVEFRDSAAAHPHYRTYGKRFCARGKFCEYVTFLSPGPSSRLLLSVTLTRPKHPATSIELDAYKHVVASLDTN